MKKIIIYSILALNILFISTSGFASSATIRWRAVPLAHSYILEIKKQNSIVVRKRVFSSNATFNITYGNYKGRISVLNKFGKVRVRSPWFNVIVKKSYPPTLQSISKKVFIINKETPFIITGDKFIQGCSVYVTSFGRTVRMKNVKYLNSRKLSCIFKPDKNIFGNFDLYIQNPGGIKSFDRKNIIISRRPEYKNISINKFNASQSDKTIIIVGNYFIKNGEIFLQKKSTIVYRTPFVFINSKKIKVTLNPQYLGYGKYDIIIKNPGNQRTLVTNVISIKSYLSLESSDGEYNDKIKLTWESVDNVQQYYIYRSSSFKGVYNKIAETGSNSYEDGQVIPGKKYYYKIRPSFGRNNLGKFSSIDSGFIKITKPEIFFREYINRLDVAWSTLPGKNKYEIYRSKSLNGEYTKIGETNKNTWHDTSIKKDKEYYYKLKVQTKWGYTIDSETVIGSSTKNMSGYYMRGFLPGWGQFYLNKNWKGFTFSIGFASSIGLFSWSLYNLNQKKQEYENLEFGLDKSEYDKKYKEYEEASFITIGTGSFVALVYIFNWIDILFFNKDSQPPWDKKINNSAGSVSFNIDVYKDNIIKNNNSNVTVSCQYRF